MTRFEEMSRGALIREAEALAVTNADLETQNAERMHAMEDLWGRLRSAESKAAETLLCFNLADAAVARLRAALEPFANARLFEDWDALSFSDETGLPGGEGLTFGNFRRARSALEETK